MIPFNVLHKDSQSVCVAESIGTHLSELVPTTELGLAFLPLTREHSAGRLEQQEKVMGRVSPVAFAPRWLLVDIMGNRHQWLASNALGHLQARRTARNASRVPDWQSPSATNSPN